MRSLTVKALRSRRGSHNTVSGKGKSPSMWRWSVLGALIGLLFACIICMPARWLAGAIASASNQQVLLQQVRGTLWNGSAKLVLSGGKDSHDSMLLPGRLNWRLHPAWIGVDVQLLPDCCSSSPLKVKVRIGWRQLDIQVADHVSQWPTSLLQGLGAPWNTLQVNGEMGLRFSQYAWHSIRGRNFMQGRIELSLSNASSSLATVRPLGSYRMVIFGSESPQVRLQTDSGPLLLSGKGQWQGSRFRFSGQATSDAEHLSALSNLLSLLGRRDGDRAILEF